MTISHETPVLISGAGPSGLILALQLAHHGVRCMLIERNEDTTRWPKMDITNCRSMELFNRLGIAEGLREQGVPQNFSFDVLFSTGLSEGGQLICKWDLPSPNAWRERISSCNDGSMPREPYQRCSQAIFESWLKRRIQTDPLIESRFGLKLESFVERSDGVESTLVDVVSGESQTVRSSYLAGCDGAGSRTRKNLGYKLIGGPVPMAMYLVHFKSRDLTKFHQGQFWHTFFSHGGVIIAQDEVDTWTTHLPIPLDADWKSMNPEDAIYKVLGGSGAPLHINVDQVLVSSAWRPNICIAERYTSDKSRVFLLGDAAHQNIPTGGYGMNTAVGDSFDLGWKLAAVLNGWGGEHLLASYEAERKPVAVRNIERSGVHQKVHQDYVKWVAEAGPGVVSKQSDEGAALRDRIREHVLSHDGENKDHGIEMGYRYDKSPIVVPDNSGEPEPESSYRDYAVSTYPGARAPHVYLADGKTSIFDLFGPEFTIVDFTAHGDWAARFAETAAKLQVPLKQVILPHEAHVHAVWGRDAALIRPDDHISWRAPIGSGTPDTVDVEHILKVAIGQELAHHLEYGADFHAGDTVGKKGFTATIGNIDQDFVTLLGEFQQ